MAENLKYKVVVNQDLSKLQEEVNQLMRGGWRVGWDLFVVRTNEKITIALASTGTVSAPEGSGSYSGASTWTWTPEYVNIYHQVMLYCDDGAWYSYKA